MNSLKVRRFATLTLLSIVVVLIAGCWPPTANGPVIPDTNPTVDTALIGKWATTDSDGKLSYTTISQKSDDELQSDNSTYKEFYAVQINGKGYMSLPSDGTPVTYSILQYTVKDNIWRISLGPTNEESILEPLIAQGILKGTVVKGEDDTVTVDHASLFNYLSTHSGDDLFPPECYNDSKQSLVYVRVPESQ